MLSEESFIAESIMHGGLFLRLDVGVETASMERSSQSVTM